MIVNELGNGMLQLVRQPDHAAMSAQIARAWRRPAAFSDELWRAVVDAVEHHDDGWTESEKLPLVDDDGRPLDFKTMPTQTHSIIWRRSVTEARGRHRLCGLIVALYARWLYTSEGAAHVDDDRIAQQFVNELTTQVAEDIDYLSQQDDASRTAVDPKNLQSVVRLVSVFDALSLALLGGLSWFDATEPLAFADQHSALTLQRGENEGDILVDPWPFDGDSVALSAPVCEVRAKRYKYPLEVAEQMNRAKAKTLSFVLKP